MEANQNVLQKRFTYLNAGIGFVSAVYLIFLSGQGRETPIGYVVFFGINVVLLIIDMVLEGFRYFYKESILKTIRYLELFAVTAAVVWGTTARDIIVAVSVFYSLLLVENLFVHKLEKNHHGAFVTALIEFPIIICYFSKYIYYGFDMEMLSEGLILLIYTIIIVTSGMLIFAEQSVYIKEELREQKQLNFQFQRMNDNLLMKQEELEKANHQMIQQRNELKLAYDKINRSNSEMMIQNLIQRYISSSLELNKLMELIMESLSEALVVNACGIVVQRDFLTGKYLFSTRTTFGPKATEKFSSHIQNKKYIEKYQQLKEPFIDNDVDLKKYDFLEGLNIKSLLIYPLIKDEKCMGLLIIGKKTKNYFLENITFFETVSSQISIAITNAQIYQSMEAFAERDGLTGIYNRRYLSEQINFYIASSISQKKSLVVILFDIDKFKTINDTYGHLFGDEVIKKCAKTANDIASENSGIAARYGGEEFVIVLQDKTLAKVKKVVDNLHERIKKEKIEFQEKEAYIDISIGITSYPDLCPDPAELLNRADWAMYNSKRNGRGRSTFDSEEINKSM